MYKRQFIYFSGIKTSSGDQTATLKSIAGITTWIIEEGEDFKDEKTFDTIDDSIRTSTHQNRVIWIQNPTTREHFIYKKFIKDTNKQIDVGGYSVTVSNHPQVEHIHTTYHVAEQLGYLNKSWLQKANDSRAKAEKDHALYISTNGEQGIDKQESHYYHNYVGGWLERAEGAIFRNWIEGAFDYTLPSCVPLDWGYSPDPLAVSRMAVNTKAKLIYVEELIYRTEVDDVAAALGRAGVNKKELIVCDTNEPRTKNAVKAAGYNINNAVKDRIVDDIRAIKKYTIVVTPKSSNYKTELNNYEWNDEKASVPIDEFNHLLDGMRYGFNRLTRGRRKIRRSN